MVHLLFRQLIWHAAAFEKFQIFTAPDIFIEKIWSTLLKARQGEDIFCEPRQSARKWFCISVSEEGRENLLPELGTETGAPHNIPRTFFRLMTWKSSETVKKYHLIQAKRRRYKRPPDWFAVLVGLVELWLFNCPCKTYSRQEVFPCFRLANGQLHQGVHLHDDPRTCTHGFDNNSDIAGSSKHCPALSRTLFPRRNSAFSAAQLFSLTRIQLQARFYPSK